MLHRVYFHDRLGSEVHQHSFQGINYCIKTNQVCMFPRTPEAEAVSLNACYFFNFMYAFEQHFLDLLRSCRPTIAQQLTGNWYC
ncbi:hypothetical protein M758_11G030000 [Ceratodon purpureus]|nr:hypothetical protein M758_11G029900 [Ceratodon purpureus]KAG0600390.1 hypothetical protein M758_11G030000 [Ceratodon purpureus]